jgi:hypothetical protein
MRSTRQSGAWPVASAYIKDYQSELGFDVFSKLQGAIRARDVGSVIRTVEEFSLKQPGEVHLRLLSQVKGFFSKNTSLVSADGEETAASTFFRMEERCALTNARLMRFAAHAERYPLWLQNAIGDMQSDIAALLGPIDVYLNELPQLVRLTSGATVTTSRQQSRRDLKLRRKVTVTPGCAPLLKTLLAHLGLEEGVRLQYVDHNRLEFVPKNWKTKRTIACEATGNLVCQLTYDSFAKSCLKAWRVDLSHGQSTNSAKAKLGSIDGGEATVDFESASDCTAARAVELLWPSDWYQLLMRMRSPWYKLTYRTKDRGVEQVHAPYHKFSSMGNGTTFTIETTIFAAAARAVGSKTFAVYGDDVVIERKLAPRFMRLCKFLGFHINREKTHWLASDGFRESCGEDYYKGVLITPFYLRNDAELRREVCHNINGLVSIARPGGRLARLLVSAAQYRKLPFVPFNSDTGSGIFLSAYEFYARWEERQHAGRIGLRFGDYHQPEFKGLVEVARKGGSGRSYKRLLLWYLEKARGRSCGLLPGSSELRAIDGYTTDGPITYVSTSKWDSDNVLVRVTWKVWDIPGPTPTHLFWWDEFCQLSS